MRRRSRDRRLSDEAAAALRLFVNHPERSRFGLEVIKMCSIRSGSLYPILRRFEERGLIVGSWEPLEEAAAKGRRPRRLYRLYEPARGTAEALLREWEEATQGASPPGRRGLAEVFTT